jgi:hypothetical protein
MASLHHCDEIEKRAVKMLGFLQIQGVAAAGEDLQPGTGYIPFNEDTPFPPLVIFIPQHDQYRKGHFPQQIP